MSDQELAKKILSLVGGKKNIKNVASCMTRLRLSLNDVSLANIDELKKLDGVLGVVQADTLQIVLGPGKVTKVAEQFAKLVQQKLSQTQADDALDEVKAQAAKNRLKIKRNMISLCNVDYNMWLMSLFHCYQGLSLPD